MSVEMSSIRTTKVTDINVVLCASESNVIPEILPCSSLGLPRLLKSDLYFLVFVRKGRAPLTGLSGKTRCSLKSDLAPHN